MHVPYNTEEKLLFFQFHLIQPPPPPSNILDYPMNIKKVLQIADINTNFLCAVKLVQYNVCIHKTA